MPNVEDVFRLSGIPTYTFVQPQRFNEIKVAVRTAGRCIVLEGPSGIGKTTTITKILKDLGIEKDVLSLSARRTKDIDIIRELPAIDSIGTVIVDDFHRLDDEIKAALSDYMKILADSEDRNSKLILIGINKAGEQLVKFAHDLGMRIDVFRLETNPIEAIEELIGLGEKALNVTLSTRQEVAKSSQGSFQIAQLLCHKLCLLGGVTETTKVPTAIEVSINVALEDVMQDLGRQFKEVVVTFARGSKLRREGRAPYLHILRWLSEADEWSLDLSEAMRIHPSMKGSIGQVIEKNYLEVLIQGNSGLMFSLSDYFHFERSTSIISVEDPKIIFYLKNLIWRNFTRQVGFRADFFQGRYDFALSFAGADRELASTLKDKLEEREVPTFYDINEQHRIISRNVEDYLAPIYRSEARYVVVIQSPSYPTRIWTKFESDNFRERFGSDTVIPIRYTTVQAGFFSEDAKFGGLMYDPMVDLETQAQQIVETLCARLIDDREEAKESDRRI